MIPRRRSVNRRWSLTPDIGHHVPQFSHHPVTASAFEKTCGLEQCRLEGAVQYRVLRALVEDATKLWALHHVQFHLRRPIDLPPDSRQRLVMDDVVSSQPSPNCLGNRWQ
jgi:hypothetical protein